MNNVFDAFYGLTQTHPHKPQPRGQHPPAMMADALWHVSEDFRCANCKNHVSSAQFLSGVKNRNHCPYCLWSRHLDLYKAGDRMAACKGKMRPVGLTLKKTRNKYARKRQGELMLVHLCTECEKVSINRVAADDDIETLFMVFRWSQELDEATGNRLRADGIRMLDPHEAEGLRYQLMGRV